LLIGLLRVPNLSVQGIKHMPLLRIGCFFIGAKSQASLDFGQQKSTNAIGICA
jgi:hypothetical protein